MASKLEGETVNGQLDVQRKRQNAQRLKRNIQRSNGDRRDEGARDGEAKCLEESAKLVPVDHLLRGSALSFGPDFVVEPGFAGKDVCSNEAAAGECAGSCLGDALAVSKNGEPLPGLWHRVEGEIGDDEQALGVDQHNDAARLGYGDKWKRWFGLRARWCWPCCSGFLTGLPGDLARGILVELLHRPCGSGECACAGSPVC